MRREDTEEGGRGGDSAEARRERPRVVAQNGRGRLANAVHTEGGPLPGVWLLRALCLSGQRRLSHTCPPPTTPAIASILGFRMRHYYISNAGKAALDLRQAEGECSLAYFPCSGFLQSEKLQLRKIPSSRLAKAS